VNVDEQAQIQLLALSLKELIQSSAMTALDQLFVFLAVIMRSLGEIRCPAAHNAVGLAGESPAVGIDCLST
jgi:hypothetical protein